MPDVDPGRCDSRNILGVIMEVNLIKDLHKIGTKSGILNLLNQFTTCSEVTVNISEVPSINGSFRECAGKASVFAVQRYKICNCKTSC